MASLRSSLPSRLRHILHGESSVNPHLKLNSDSPSKIKEFIEKVIQSPLHDIAIPLSGFRWQYNKGNFYHWRPLFLHFETYLKTFISSRHDLLLSDDIFGSVGPFPKHEILQILRATQIILENCHNKSAFPGLEHFKLLLASTDPEVLIATLEALYALVKINPCNLRSNGKLIACGTINSCLLSLANGWGSKEEGLGLYSCIVANENIQEEGLSLFPSDIQNQSGECIRRQGSTVYFELHCSDSDISGRCAIDNAGPSRSDLIVMPDLHFCTEDDLSLMKQCLEQYSVPNKQRFALLSRIRFSHAFRSPRMCRLFSRISLLASMVLVQSDDASEELVSFFATEPEYTNELIRIVRSDDLIPANIRTLAMLALGSQLAAHSSSHDRARILSGSGINFSGGNRTILLNVLQRAVIFLSTTNDPSSLGFVEALFQFYLLHVVTSSTSGTLIRGSGMVPTFLPLLKDHEPTHLHLVCLSVKILKKLVDCSHSAATLFKDLGGVDLLAQRLQAEVHSALCPVGISGGSICVEEGLDNNDVLVASQKRLVKNILKALVSATFASVSSSRSQNPQENPLPTTLSVIFTNAEKFGGDIYSSAVNVMSESLHKDPTCFSALHELGLPDAFLGSVVAGVIPSSKALNCIPNGLGAICLNPKGVESVKATSALRFLIEIFSTKKYVSAMNSAVVTLASGVEELLRHTSSLRSIGADILIEIVQKISVLMDENVRNLSKREVGSSEMETDDRARETSCGMAGSVFINEPISDEQFVQLSVFHMMVLVQRTLDNAETCRLFVERSGIEFLLKLISHPSSAQPADGMSIALHSTLIFKTFSQHHSATLARSYCNSLRDQLTKALNGFAVVSGSLLLDPKAAVDSELFHSLTLIEFLLFLAASKDNRWVTALLSELGNDSKDVLEDLGRLHREILWQTSLLDDSKPEPGLEDTGSGVGSHQSSLDATETVEQRFNSLSHLLQPLLRRRTSGWTVDGQIYDLVNLYHGVMQTNGLPGRHIHPHLHRADTPSEVRPMSDHQSNGFNSSVAGESSVKKGEKQRSCYSSCCDMLRALSTHIANLFLELGKAMLVPSRRREDSLSIAPACKSVASSIASIAHEHFYFAGLSGTLSSEVTVSTKCRYFGKVIEFIDTIVMEKQESCNPVLLNCFYTHKVVQSVLDTFEATNQLLFAVNGVSSTPMETDDVNPTQSSTSESDNSWIFGPLASYGKFMDHIVTSSFILSPSTKHLLAQPLVASDVPFPENPKNFVRTIQSMVLKAVLPVWNHSQFPDCSYAFVSAVVSIMKHVYSGIEVRSVSSSTARLSGPPPNEISITTIADMGFSRTRAEEALRHVGANSVELAMEWLFSHPEESQEEDELARALAMSLGGSTVQDKDSPACDSGRAPVEVTIELPPAEELLSSCIKLIPVQEELAFPIHKLLLMMCTQKDGEGRSDVISFLVEQVKQCVFSTFDSKCSSLLSSLFHVLALILNEDAPSREVALEKGLVKLCLDLISEWDYLSFKSVNCAVPKWVIAAFLAIDRMLSVNQKLNPEVIEQLKNESLPINGQSISIDESKGGKMYAALGFVRCLEEKDQKRIVDVACNCMKNKLPPDALHAVLHLCSTITKHHDVAIQFLDAGGLPLLLSPPTTSLFSGYDVVASTIIRHILEDPQTLQQSMESKIRYSFATSASRHPNGRTTPRTLLSNLSTSVSRDPVVFMRAVQSLCHVEMAGDRPCIVLSKEREKDKCSREKGKDKEKSLEKDKQQSIEGKASPVSFHGKTAADSVSRNVKMNRKPPNSFVTVVEYLLDLVLTHVPEQQKGEMNSSSSSMDIDTVSTKGKGKAIASPLDANDPETFTSLVKVVFVMKILVEALCTYPPTTNVVLRRDAEISSSRVNSGCCSGGLFSHILQKLLPRLKYSKKESKGEDWTAKLSGKAIAFMAAASARSSDARRRIFMLVNTSFINFVDSSASFKEPIRDIQVLIQLLNDTLIARPLAGSAVPAESSSSTFVDVGLVRSLTRVLQVLDLDHQDSPKVTNGIVKALEYVSKEHVRTSSLTADRGGSAAKDSDQNQSERVENTGNSSQLTEVAPRHRDSLVSDLSNAEEAYSRPEPVSDDMDRDNSFDPGEDDYMHETPDVRGLDNGAGNVSIRFEIQTHGQENMVDGDDDEVMSADDDDEDEDDDDGHNDLEEDDVHHLQHPDTDQDDHEIDEDEFEEEVLEEEEDEDDDDGVVFRLEDSVNGFNFLENIEVLGRGDSFPNDAFHVMPLDVFGSRNEGRTTSIYNLLARRNNTSSGTSSHPLLVARPYREEPSRPTGDAAAAEAPDGNLEGSSRRLEEFFGSLVSGRLRYTVVEDHPIGGPLGSSPQQNQALEDLLLTVLSRPSAEKSPQKKNANSEQNEIGSSEALILENGNEQLPQSAAPSVAGNGANTEDADVLVRENADSAAVTAGADSRHAQGGLNVEHHPDMIARDAEAVSQGSSESGATLGESLRSLDVEIGSADGHDDGIERQGGSDVVPARPRRSVNLLFGGPHHPGARDLPLYSVTEGLENPLDGDGDPGGREPVDAGHHGNGNADSGVIDPAFLDALPEELRAEVLSAQQGQTAQQPANPEPQNAGDIDPEFLAALPPDIRAEVLAQQQTQRLHQSHELEGQPVEMDTVSIIATFPSELREEVLLTSSDAILANLTPALVAEANMLRERFANRYHNRSLISMYPRSRRGESSRRGEGISSALDRGGGRILSHRLPGNRLVEAEGAPLIYSEGLRALIRLLRVFQPILYKGQLQKLLLNLCSHNEVRVSLANILLDMLLLHMRKTDDGMSGSAEPAYRMYACQSHVACSRPQIFHGIPPLLSRRVLEMLTYLARNHPFVANVLLSLRMPHTEQNHDKAVMGQEGSPSVVLLLGLLNQPLYLRSTSHLEQLLSLLEVIIDNAGNKLAPRGKPGGDAAAGAEPNDSVSTSSKGEGEDVSPHDILLNLPQPELQRLCSFLAREGLSENAYLLVAEVLKKLVSIVPSHRRLFIFELAKCVQGLTTSAIDELHTFCESVKSRLGLTASAGAAVLRVLQALSSLDAGASFSSSPREDQQIVLNQILGINTVLEPLWLELSACISNIESFSDNKSAEASTSASSSVPSGVTPPLPAGAQNILPYIESFFVVCEKLHSGDGEDGRPAAGGGCRTDERHVAFVKFSDRHRKLLNGFIRQNPGLLEKSFILMLKVPRLIDFDNKRAYFRSKIKHQHEQQHHGSLRISVRRAYVLEDSYNQLRMRSAQDLRGRLTVHFQGEEGIDAGGLTREWYQLLSRVIFDKGALLFTTVGNESTFQPNPNSVYQTEHLSYFKFVGRVVGKALFDAQLLDVHFTRSFYKHILGVKVTYHDIEAIDPDYFKNLKWMLENDIMDVLDLTFSIDADEEKLILYEKTEVTDYELIPDGRNMRVTEENKHKYVDLVAEHRLTTAIRPQINAFLEGFSELISHDLISIFHDKELELLISGLPDIDLDDMRANTEYSGFSAVSPVIQWFWDVVYGFSKEDKARLLQFVTGTSKVPLEGFSALQGISGTQKFQIHKAYGSPDHLPSAHTCFNQLDLPEYPSKPHMEKRLLLAIHEANEGFGFG